MEDNNEPPLPQPTPPPYPLIKDLSSILGFTFPTQSKVVMWPGGIYKTRLPWVSDPDDPEKNLLENVCLNFVYLLTCFTNYC
jgi:hypothetical protein